MPLEVVPLSAIEAIAATAPVNGHQSPSKQRPNVDRTASRTSAPDDVKDRARKYLATIPGGVQGENGTRPTFRAACVLVNDYALSCEDAYDLLMEYNARCEPPWDEMEVWRMLGNAEKRRDGNYGSKAGNTSRPTGESGRTEQRESRPASTRKPILKLTAGELKKQFPRLSPPVLDGLCREAETVNVISVSKIGKSWLIYGLLLCIIMGRRWLGQFATSPGRVLLIDNELHASVLAHRLPAVAKELGIADHEYADKLEVWSLRGNLKSLVEVAEELKAIEPGTFKAIVFDAKYRFATSGQSENDNAAETLLYNLIDEIAERTKAAIFLVHHASKGGQSDKRTTDVGAGAGAQSRAADCHLILREHEEENQVVLDAAVRSFAPVQPIVLEWQFPLWVPVDDGDPTRLKGSKSRGEEQQSERDVAADGLVLKHSETWRSRPELRKLTGMGDTRLNRTIARLRSAQFLEASTEKRNGNDAEVFRKTIHAR